MFGSIKLKPKAIKTFLKGIDMLQSLCEDSPFFISLSPHELSLFTVTKSLEVEAPMKLFLTFQSNWLVDALTLNPKFQQHNEQLKNQTFIWMIAEPAAFFEMMSSFSSFDCTQMELLFTPQIPSKNPALGWLKACHVGKDTGLSVQKMCSIEFAKMQLPVLPPQQFELMLFCKLLPQLLQTAISKATNVEIKLNKDAKQVHFGLSKEHMEVVITSNTLRIESAGDSLSKASNMPARAESGPTVWELAYKNCKKLLWALDMETFPVRFRMLTTGEAVFERGISTFALGGHREEDDEQTPSKNSFAGSACGSFRIQLALSLPKPGAREEARQ